MKRTQGSDQIPICLLDYWYMGAIWPDSPLMLLLTHMHEVGTEARFSG